MSTDEATLLSEAVAGNKQSLTELLKRVGPAVRGKLTGRIAEKFRSAFDEEDVMQVTFVEAYMRIRSFEPRSIEAFIGWLTKIAEHNLLDAAKELNRKKRPARDKQVQPARVGDSYVSLMGMLGATSTTPSRDAAEREAKDIIDRALNRLPSDYRQVLLLHHFEGLPGPEVAHRMNRSLGAVYMLRARAIEHLRTKLPTESAFFTRPG